ncbi:MAG: diaminopimelate decarboxylase [Deltaproteobacteria bacterium]|nr:diaminopimelate decarboxylase [Deltaproteobacteria bacterium]
MDHFQYRDNRLYAEDVPVEKIAAEVGTPVYIYSHATLMRHFLTFDRAFNQVDHLTCFSVKSNSNLALLSLFSTLGGGMDIVSGGELYRALKSGVPPRRIVYSGVGKTVAEIDLALKTGILMFNIESPQELEMLSQRAQALDVVAPIALRVNPDVDPKTHPYISTGLKMNKFGINIEKSRQEYIRAAKMPGIKVIGVDFHIGSQLTSLEPFMEALVRIRYLISVLRAEGLSIQYLDIGGGLGITYNLEEPPHPDDYAQAIIVGTEDLGVTLIMEPGRVIVGNAGILVTRVLYIKRGEAKNFIIVDAGMNDLIRPSIYNSFHTIRAVDQPESGTMIADVVGPICESGDFFAKDREVPVVSPGQLLSIMSAGAYGFSMSSNYNSRPRAAEVMTHGAEYRVIRERESYDDLTRLETVPNWVE